MPVIAPTSVRTVTVGIPASNEEKSIGQMLESVLNQAIPQGVLLTTVVVANACTDQTVQVALGVIEQVLGIVARPVESEEGRTWVAEARPITACVLLMRHVTTACRFLFTCEPRVKLWRSV